MGFIFAFINIALFDFISGKMGLWTIITATCYGLLALFSAWYFKHRSGTSLQFAIHAVYATLIYDAITGLTIGPLFFWSIISRGLYRTNPIYWLSSIR
jgi:hypothetical protein